MTLDDALEAITSAGDPTRAQGMADYHKVPRTYLGCPNPVLNDLSRDWRKALDLDARVALADGLWQTNIHEARVCAAKLLTQARIRPDDAVWELIVSWVPDFDAWAIADHACSAGARRLTADPARLDVVETWTQSDNHWTKRAAMVMTLPWTKQNHPTEAERAARERILGWAADYIYDPEWFIQKSVAWWLRELSKHDPDRVRAFMAAHAPKMKKFARKEAEKYLPKAD
ncbi:MAG: DNA alkylation repair protein [Pelagimonas sp.]|jgi:3-methyladenine DNA glycosylase AlkD|nr:DNA alkylation repair protein [Pelagimonas sp.]